MSQRAWGTYYYTETVYCIEKHLCQPLFHSDTWEPDILKGVAHPKVTLKVGESRTQPTVTLDVN